MGRDPGFMGHDEASKTKAVPGGDFATWAELSILLGRLGPDHATAELSRLGIDVSSFESESARYADLMREEQARGTPTLARRYAAIAQRSVGLSASEVRRHLDALATRLEAGPPTARQPAHPSVDAFDDTLPFLVGSADPPLRIGSPREPKELGERGGTAVGTTLATDDTLPFVRGGPAPMPFVHFVEWRVQQRLGHGKEREVLESIGIRGDQAQRAAILYWERRVAKDDLLRARLEALVSLRRSPTQ